MTDATVKPESLVRRYYECLNRHAFAEALALLAPEASLRAAGSRPREGAADIAGFLDRAFAPYKEHRDEINRLIVAGPTVVAELTFSGRLENGREIGFEALTVFDVEDGRIVRIANWTDTQGVRAALAAALAGASDG